MTWIPDGSSFVLEAAPQQHDRVDIFVPDVVSTSSDLDAATLLGRTHRHVHLLLPFCSVRLAGRPYPWQDRPVIALASDGKTSVSRSTFLRDVHGGPLPASVPTFDSDDEYEQLVRRIIDEHIGKGDGSNFVIHRAAISHLLLDWRSAAVRLFHRLLAREPNAYKVFCVVTNDGAIVGASPERHVTVRDNEFRMTPISGTLRLRPGQDPQDVHNFVEDTKERDELDMVLDEELKIAARVCDRDIRITGPDLVHHRDVAHTGYEISGHTEDDPLTILVRTLFAPTVTGSPIDRAVQVIGAVEERPRSYYAGVFAHIEERDERVDLDSAILIRTAEIDVDARLVLRVGATVTRDSVPSSEAAETRAKAKSLLSCLDVEGQIGEPSWKPALDQRRSRLSAFWLGSEPSQVAERPLSVTLVNNKDAFTAMLAYQLKSRGHEVREVSSQEPLMLDTELVVFGPGPGDPNDEADPRIRNISAALTERLVNGLPFLSVCLSHQVLSSLLGLQLARRDRVHQGRQVHISWRGRRVSVAFYNSFAVWANAEDLVRLQAKCIEPIHLDEDGSVIGLRGTSFASMQFHAESVLAPDGFDLLCDEMERVAANGR